MKRLLRTLLMLRNKRLIKQSTLCQYMNISRVELSTFERGKRRLTFERVIQYIKAIENYERENSKKGLSKYEKSELIESLINDFIEELALISDNPINVIMSKNVCYQKAEIITILPDGRVMDIKF